MPAALLMALLVALPSLRALEAPELADGVRQLREGDLEGAVLSLDAAIRELGPGPARAKDVARAYLYLGVAYAGLGQEGIARAKFRQALLRDPGLTLSADEFALKAVRAFEAARREVETGAGLAAQVGRRRGKTPFVLLGLGGLAAAGLAASLGGERENRPPTALLTAAPPGVALVRATVMSFTGSGSDPDAEPLSYSWSFGDGVRAAGQNATHVYTRSGDFTVTLEVRDGLSATTATASVSARTLSGRWRASPPLFGTAAFLLTQYQDAGTALAGRPLDAPQDQECLGGGAVAETRRVNFDYKASSRFPHVAGAPCPFSISVSGEGDALLQAINATWFCNGGTSGHTPCQRGQTGSFLLVRE